MERSVKSAPGIDEKEARGLFAKRPVRQSGFTKAPVGKNEVAAVKDNEHPKTSRGGVNPNA